MYSTVCFFKDGKEALQSRLDYFNQFSWIKVQSFDESGFDTTKTLRYINNKPPRLVGNKNGKAIYSENTIREIKTLLRTKKLKHREIGDMFGIRTSYITQINNGYVWSHIVLAD